MSIFNKQSLKFLEAYLNNASPTGFESRGQELWLKNISPYIDTHYTDVYGNCVGIINPKSNKKIVIEAHADEISWFVHYITPEGFIYVKRNGGSDHQIAPSKRVLIHTEKGIVPAVFGWPAIHTRTTSTEESPKLKNIFLDCGCSTKEEVEALGVHIGCVITYPDPMVIMNKNRIVGRALDNRLGGFMISETAKLLYPLRHKLPFGIYFVNAVQEEVGLRGAEMISRRIKPNVALVVDVCHDTQTPMIEKKLEGDIVSGNGPVLTYGPAVQYNLLQHLLHTAGKNKIPFQRQAVSRATGTDTDAFAYSSEGVASALISIPLRYMHTTVEMAHKDDAENGIKLLTECIKSMKKDCDFSYSIKI